MSWFAVDDRFHSHRKVLRLRRSDAYPTAVALWTLAGSWACGQEVERFTGHVPVDVLTTFGLADWQDGLDALVDVDLWACDDGEQIRFHDWEQWNGTGSREHRSKEQTRVRQHAFRLKRCLQGTHSKDCPTTDLDGNPHECPRRRKTTSRNTASRDADNADSKPPKTPRNSASRDAGSGRVGTGRDGHAPTWDPVPEHLRTPGATT